MKTFLSHCRRGEIGPAWKHFVSKEGSHFLQFCKYGFFGGLAFLTHMAVFELMGMFVLPFGEGVEASVRTRNTMIDFGAGFFFGNLVAYITNIKWVFVDGKFSRATESVMFFLVSGLSVVIGLVLIRFIEPPLSAHAAIGPEIGPRVANLVNIVTAVMINYTARKFFIFKG